VDPRCQLACVAFNASIAAAIRGEAELSTEALVEAAERELLVGAPLLTRGWEDLMVEANQAVQDLKEDLRLARQPDPELYGPELHLTQSHKAGFVRVAFRLAYWELLHAPSFEAAMVDITNRGGDADTNAAIAGALLGAFHGEDAIPAEWRAQVLGALQGRALDPLWTTYHPRVLMQLVEARFDA
jgi:ADP-ribosylglycohydrolase